VANIPLYILYALVMAALVYVFRREWKCGAARVHAALPPSSALSVFLCCVFVSFWSIGVIVFSLFLSLSVHHCLSRQTNLASFVFIGGGTFMGTSSVLAAEVRPGPGGCLADR
jgi:hypothetical protein